MLGLFRERALLGLVGVDFGTHTLKAVTLAGRAGKFAIESAVEVATPKGALVEHQLQDIERIGGALKSLRSLLRHSGSLAATAVSGSHVFSRVLQLERELDGSDLGTRVQLEAEQLIPFPLDEVSIDYEVLGPSPNDPARHEVLLSAARTESINGRVMALAEAGWQTRVVDVATHALGRAVLACYPELAAEGKVVALLDVGATTLSFAAMVRGEVIYSRLQNFGGDNYTQSIATFYNLPLDEAEQAKLRYNLPDHHEQDVTGPHVNALLQHIRRNSQLFCSASSFRELGTLVLCGGGSLMPELPAMLTAELGIEVLHPDPFALFAGESLQLAGQGPRFMTAFGLALRSFIPCPR